MIPGTPSSAVGVEVQRVEEIVVDAAIEHVDRV
jgi:hypothetical protein